MRSEASMTPTQLRALVAAMTPAPWAIDVSDLESPRATFVGPAGDPQECYDKDVSVTVPVICGAANGTLADLRGVRVLRNLAPALVDLWDAVEAYRVTIQAADYDAREEAEINLLAAAKRVGG